MKLYIIFKDAHMPQKINLLSDKELFTHAEKTNEAARLLREKDPSWIKRKYEVK